MNPPAPPPPTKPPPNQLGLWIGENSSRPWSWWPWSSSEWWSEPESSSESESSSEWNWRWEWEFPFPFPRSRFTAAAAKSLPPLSFGNGGELEGVKSWQTKSEREFPIYLLEWMHAMCASAIAYLWWIASSRNEHLWRQRATAGRSSSSDDPSEKPNMETTHRERKRPRLWNQERVVHQKGKRENNKWKIKAL